MFNQPLDKWNLASMKDMSSMFKGGGFNQDIAKWNVSNVENMNSMFENNKVFNQNIKKWDVEKVKKNGKHDKFADGGILQDDYNPFIETFVFDPEYVKDNTSIKMDYNGRENDKSTVTITFENDIVTIIFPDNVFNSSAYMIATMTALEISDYNASGVSGDFTIMPGSGGVIEYLTNPIMAGDPRISQGEHTLTSDYIPVEYAKAMFNINKQVKFQFKYKLI